MSAHRVFVALIVLASLASSPAAATTAGTRRTTIDTIIVHAVSGPSCAGGRLKFSGAPGDASTWKRFFDRHPFLGIHYVVDRDGQVAASTPEERIANHALDNNATSVGIELVHEGDGIEPFGEPQITALIGLLERISRRHGIAVERIKGHGDVDHRTFVCGGRSHKGRSDPGANFPWIRVVSALTGPQPDAARVAVRRPAPPAPVQVEAPQLLPPRLLVRPREVFRPEAPAPYGLGLRDSRQ